MKNDKIVEQNQRENGNNMQLALFFEPFFDIDKNHQTKL